MLFLKWMRSRDRDLTPLRRMAQKDIEYEVQMTTIFTNQIGFDSPMPKVHDRAKFYLRFKRPKKRSEERKATCHLLYSTQMFIGLACPILWMI